MIELDHVGKTYGAQPVVSDLTLTIARGEFCVLIGPSGCGKSTTLRMINRLIEHSEGAIRIDGAEIRSFPEEVLRRRMGYVIQSVGLFPHWTVARNIATVPTLLGWPRRRIADRVDELLALLRLDPRTREAYPHSLSGGQQQRVGVARALAADPDVLLMDEPFGALDPITRDALQAEMLRIHRTVAAGATAKTIVFVTHDMDEALRLADRIVLLRAGRMVQAGPPLELLTAPADDFVRDFIGQDAGLKQLAVQTAGSRARAQDVPPPDAEAIGAGESLRAALSRMLSRHVDRLAVVDEDGIARGTLHLADLVRA